MRMNKRQSKFTAQFCGAYEELLGESQEALEAWSRRREEAWQMGLRGKELGGELLRLQAEFAKSYARLQQHARECVLCEFVSKMAENPEGAYVGVSAESQPV